MHICIIIMCYVSISGYILFLLAINTSAFILVFCCYVSIFCQVRGSNASRNNDTYLARRMALLVFTDFICWGPVAIVAGLSAGLYSVYPPNSHNFLLSSYFFLYLALCMINSATMLCVWSHIPYKENACCQFRLSIHVIGGTLLTEELHVLVYGVSWLLLYMGQIPNWLVFVPSLSYLNNYSGYLTNGHLTRHQTLWTTRHSKTPNKHLVNV